MKTTLNILIIEHVEADYLLLARYIRKRGLEAELCWVKDRNQLAPALEKDEWDLILSDYMIPGLDFLDNLQQLKQLYPDTPVILVSGSIGEETAVDLLKSGLTDFVLKDRLFRLIPAIERSLAERNNQRQNTMMKKLQQFNTHLLELAHEHTDLEGLLTAFAVAVKAFSGVDAVGIRVLDGQGNIPCKASEGFSSRFLGTESPLSIRSDQCMCINVIRGDTDAALPCFSRSGSLYINGMSHFLSELPPEAKKELRCVCSSEGYESIALIPFQIRGRTLGLIHIADTKRNRVPLTLVKQLEGAVLQLATAFERARAQHQLQEREQLLRAIVDHAASSIWVKDTQGKIQMANSFLLRLLGKSAEEVIGGTVFDLLPWDQAAELSENENRILASGVPAEIEESIIIGGRMYTMLAIKFPLLSPDGKAYALGAIATDITRIKDTEYQLKIQQELYHRLSQEYRTVLDSVPDGIVYLSPDLQVRWVNTAARRLFNLPDTDSLQGQMCHELFWNEAKACVTCPARQAQATGQIEIGRIVMQATAQEFEIRAIPVFDETGLVEGIIEIIRDQTAQRRLEAQIRQAQKMESVGTLAGGIAHDFNNILSAILGYGEMALEDLADNHPAKKSVHTIVEAGMRASHLTKDLLLFSRKQVSHREPVELNGIISRLEKFIRRVIGEDIVCQTHLVKQAAMIHADAHQIEQVLMNFATNARDAMPNGGSFTITTECVNLDKTYPENESLVTSGPCIVIRAADTGKGMDQATADKIFEPFFTTKDVGRGTGLGLSVVYGIIKEHQGLIEVHSQPGKGTEMRVYLPMTGQEETAPGTRQTHAAPQGGSETILFAEDEAAVRNLYASVLRQQGYTVLEATNGEDALRLFKAHAPSIDMLLCDLVMPKMNGKQALEAIRAIQPEIRGIFISGYAPENMQLQELTDLGMTLLPKPVPIKELLRTVRKVLDRDDVH